MKNVIVERSTVNIEALDADLRAALGAATSGFSISGSKIVVHLVDNATAQQEAQAQQIVQNHDPAKLTAAQQAEILRQQQLAQARISYGVNPIDVAAYGSQSTLIQQLAQKISWLEQEIADQRAGG